MQMDGNVIPVYKFEGHLVTTPKPDGILDVYVNTSLATIAIIDPIFYRAFYCTSDDVSKKKPV
jgi:hypothetical protein